MTICYTTAWDTIGSAGRPAVARPTLLKNGNESASVPSKSKMASLYSRP